MNAPTNTNVMNRVTLSSILLASLNLVDPAEAFMNLDFENAVIVPQDPNFGFLDWGLAVPGWSHGGGLDSGFVYYGSIHIGITPWYLLRDAQHPVAVPGYSLEGNFSLEFSSGFTDSQDPAPISSTLSSLRPH